MTLASWGGEGKFGCIKQRERGRGREGEREREREGEEREERERSSCRVQGRRLTSDL